MPPFNDLSAAFFDEYFRLDPVSATGIGDHRFDDRWPDLTSAGRAARIAFAERWIATLEGHAPGDLTADERADREVLLRTLEAIRFQDTELLDERWDPLTWVYILGAGIFPLLSREFAPLADRLASVAGRLEGLPATVEAARDELVGAGERPVSRFHTEIAIRQLAGIGELVDEALAAADAAPDDTAVRAIEPRLREAAATARAALNAFESHLREVVLPAAEGEGRLGGELFAAKLRHTLRVDLSPADVLARAEHDYAVVRAEMLRLARDLWPTWLPDRPQPTAASAGSQAAADSETVRAVIDAIAMDHPKAGELLDYCRAEVGRIEAFCHDHEVIGLSDEPLEIRWTPVFLRAFGGAMLDPAGPLDRNEKSFFCITPVPEDWSPEQSESYLREQNARALRILTIHEAVPGHYLQGTYANRNPSLPRTVLWSGVFAEGWAVYVTQVMIDLGYGADDPALLLAHWKYYMRAITNAIMDVRIHVSGMTEDDAMALMVVGGFQEDAEARNKWIRARLTSTQLSTYFVGSNLFWEIEIEARRRAAVASGDPRGAAAVPEPRVIGGIGDTPGFRYREHLERVIGHGSPPMPVLRELLFGG